MKEPEQSEYDEVHGLLGPLTSQYSLLTLDELHQIFDETFDQLESELASE